MASASADWGAAFSDHPGGAAVEVAGRRVRIQTAKARLATPSSYLPRLKGLGSPFSNITHTLAPMGGKLQDHRRDAGLCEKCGIVSQNVRQFHLQTHQIVNERLALFSIVG